MRIATAYQAQGCTFMLITHKTIRLRPRWQKVQTNADGIAVKTRPKAAMAPYDRHWKRYRLLRGTDCLRQRWDRLAKLKETEQKFAGEQDFVCCYKIVTVSQQISDIEAELFDNAALNQRLDNKIRWNHIFPWKWLRKLGDVWHVGMHGRHNSF